MTPKRILFVLCFLGLATSVKAGVFRSVNRLTVITLSVDTFEVIEGRGAGASSIWCVAADYTRRIGRAEPRQRLYVLEPRGPSKTQCGRVGVIFTLAPSAAMRETPASYSVSVKRMGENLSIAHALVFCDQYIDEFLYRRWVLAPEVPGRQTAMRHIFEISTKGPGLHEFTDEVSTWLAGSGDGALVLMVQHTSASLLIQENADPDVRHDLQSFFDRLVPSLDDPRMGYLRHRLEGPDDMPAHIKAAMMPVSLTIPVAAGRLILGTWQGIYLVEHRHRPHSRRVAAQFLPAL